MFSVLAIVGRGFFRDKVLVAATEDTSHSRKRLGWDHTGAPEVAIDIIRVSKGEEFVIAFPKGSTAVGQSFSREQVAELPGFDKLWQRSAGE